MTDAIDPTHLISDILIEHGPLSHDDVIRRLANAGVTDAENAFDYLLDEIGPAVCELVDGRWVWLPTMLAERVFTHRLTADEMAHDMLTVTPDLDPVTTLCEGEQYARFVDGSRAHVALPVLDIELLEERNTPPELVHPLGALLLTPGTLASIGAAAGVLVAVRLTTKGLTVEKVTADDDASAVAEQLAAQLDTDDPKYFDAVVWTACADDPTLFTRPQQPVSEIADAAGLSRWDDQLAPAGFDADKWRFELSCSVLERRYEIDPDEAFAVNTLLEVCNRLADLIEMSKRDDTKDISAFHVDRAPDEADQPEFVELAAELGAVLREPMLAEILKTETVERRRGGAATLGLFAETLEPRVPRSARVAFRWLRAVALERTGLVDEAEQALLAAEAMDTAWEPVLMDLARFAADRGDAERALSLLRRAGVAPDDPFVALLERHRASPRPDLGRNEECWCGSGRKYKKCHLGHEQLPLADRADWLYSKAAQHVVMTGWDELLFDVVDERERYLDDDTDDELGDLLPLDAVLFEGGAFADFLQLRGFLLPEDERALAEQWLLVERSVFEVDEVRRGQDITVRDIRTGDRHEVRERLASGFLKPGTLFCGRVVPAGDTMQIFGGLEPVALHERDGLIALLDDDTDPVELVAWLSRRFAPPTLVNTDGHPLAMCRATVQVDDIEGIHAALDEVYERQDGEDPARWLEYTSAQDIRRVRAVLTLEHDTLHVDTNSAERMDDVLATLRRIAPAMTVLEDARQPIRDAREAARLAAEQPAGEGSVLDQNDPQVAAALEGFIQAYETNWLDESIPALGGYTPRQCADDPTRRPDLVKLLATFPSGVAARGGMDADRLRTALGLA